jgi:AcrR family transcriptional regulator
MPSPKVAPKLPPRPRRGTPHETRARLLGAAAEVFNRDGYEGTDSNRLARAAGYAPGTFYKHFDDKKQIFLAVYAEWFAREWTDITATIAEGGTSEEIATRVVDIFLGHHAKWRGFRASLRALVSTDPDIRSFYREQRRRQLELLADLRREHGFAQTSPESHALLSFTLERASDALADGEAEALGLRASVVRELLIELVKRRLPFDERRGA